VNHAQDRLLDRVGAAAGLAFVGLFIGIVMFAPHLPAPEHSIGEIARSAREDNTRILLATYLATLLTAAMLVFGATIAARMRRAEGPGGGWWLIALTGTAATSAGLVTQTIIVMLVRAVGHGVSGHVLWLSYPPGPDGVEIAVPLAVFLLGAGMGAKASGALPRWLAWLAVVLAAAFVVGAAGVTGNEVDGGTLGLVLLLAYLGLLTWVIGASLSMWRTPDSRLVAELAPATT
jgi:hypothetical protein